MKSYLQKVKDKIILDLIAMSEKFDFNPGLYIGKTEDFEKSTERHVSDGLPILLRIAEGNPEDIALLEDALISWAQNQNNDVFKCLNTNRGSGGNINANKLYICFDTSVEGDELFEMDEMQFLGNEYPIDLQCLKNEAKDK